LATQPVDDDPDATELYRLIEHPRTFLSEVLCYSSDYPHWDNDRPGRVFNKVSDETKRKIFSTNAAETLRL
jgi:predicted TIM-barrel fold metal-dependent hydrolase